MGSDRRRSPDRGGRGGPMRNNRRNDNPGGPRMVPYTPKRIKGSPNKRCYVNNLPYDLKWQQFKDHMKEAGNVTFVELFEDEGGKSMGCGLVEYSTPEEAKKAIESLNDSKVNGREVKVKADEVRFYPKIPDPIGPPPQMGGHGHGHGHGHGPMGPGPMGPGPMHPMDMGPPPMQQQAVSNVVFVSNLAYEITPKFLRDQFRGAGEILRVNLERDKEGKSKGFGTVTYAYPDMALRCIDMFNQKSIKGRRLSVRLDKLTSVSVPGPMGPGPMGPGPMGPGPGHGHGHHMGPGPMGPGPMGPGHGPMGPSSMGPGPMGPGPMNHGHGHGPNPMGPSPMGSSHQMGPGPVGHGSGSMGPSSGSGGPGPVDQPSGYGQQSGGYGASPAAGSDQQSKLLQSIGLAAISSMLGGTANPMLSNLINSAGAADVRGGSSSALENLLGRDTMEGLLKTQSVGGSAGGGGGSGGTSGGGGGGGYGASYSSSTPYESSSRSEHKDYSSGRDREERRSDPYGEARSSGRHSPDRYSNKYREQVSSKNQIFVKNIPFNIGTQQLRDYFRHCGHIVDCSILMEKDGRSRGCGTIRFESASDCERAVNMFHRSHLQGREIEVRLDI
ncbi:myelin expression factor 2-like isoform X2 [Bolinopsis microptera]|uniref:myelin expression factor 2-like isoform X2 n=2 Tax=Bolinopsis microptera TaxID=2820187 RepID=UPI003079FFC1